MALASGIYKHYKNLFALDDDGLRRIEGVLKKAAASYSEPLTVVFHVEREDDRFYESESVDEVLSDPNVPDKRVRLLGIELRKTAALNGPKEQDQDRVAWVVFDKDEPPLQAPSARIRIFSSDKTWALLLADELEPQVTRLFKVKKFPNWVFFLFSPIFALIGYKASTWLGYQMPESLKHGALTGLGFCGFILLLTVHTAIAEKKFKLLRLLSAEPIFLWGEEISHSADRETLRKNIFWVIVIGFIVSVLAGLVQLLL